MIVAIVGIGLIGGSLAIDLRNRKFATRIIGVDNNTLHAEMARRNGLVDETNSLQNATSLANLIILACPVNDIRHLLPGILDLIGGTQKVVTDMGSTKSDIARLVADHPHRRHYVAAHPMAGTEYSGPQAAVGMLFDNKCAIICDKEKSAAFALDLVEKLFGMLNMRCVYMDAAGHDVSAAYVSHISHISSFALSLCVLEKEKNEANIMNLAGGGFASTVRLAKSSANMWVPVFEQNASCILEVLNTYIEKLNLFKHHIESNNREGMKTLITEANNIQKVLR
jgi:prephenate dehydrogenase